jgi:hypothetical protein
MEWGRGGNWRSLFGKLEKSAKAKKNLAGWES